MQNAAFAARGLDWAYVPLRVEAPFLEQALSGVAALGFAGANVTVPHKTAAVAFCHELDAFAERAGSVNTIVVRDGRLLGSSTDGLAVVESVESVAEHVLLLGAGGAAPAVAPALLDAGVDSIRVAARKGDRSRALAARLHTLFRGRAITASEHWPPQVQAATLVVNATPVVDDAILELDADRQLVDLAYRADGKPTAFVAAARTAGCAVVDGLEILVRQGAASFERWTGIPAPLDVMRAAVRL